MLKNISDLGTVLSKKEQQTIKGGIDYLCSDNNGSTLEYSPHDISGNYGGHIINCYAIADVVASS